MLRRRGFRLAGGPAAAGVAVALLTASASDTAIAETGEAVRRLASRLSRRLGGSRPDTLTPHADLR